ncbi:SDR family oxidoreductase [Sphingosinicella soli]|uniref:NAD(P)-dependent dehydrogenase (Short-subunit alcohol dehydrogenase family) n=1 Tax=Sphingosinicella soli TaxID=333708 RepID=A0A7W7F772_9SPHN|nr:SDR family oxidoreductase [Sphingosinicella soli]MBB4632389.1 NAD(P)-dependent dehydrogenase (short-subunit alcohol dehydrogenase family) [Sphingosinicella soli]
MDLNLKAKRVLISGGTRGIGRSCAAAFLAEGAHVAIIGRSEASVAAALGDLPGVIGVAADLRQETEAAAALASVERQFGPIDILVNSAGAAQRSLPEDLSPARWRDAMDAKYFTYIHLIDPVIKAMVARRAGVIVNIIGTGGKRPVASHLPGGAANAALMLATAGLGAAYAASGVRVVGVSPGITNTDRVREAAAVVARGRGSSVEAVMAELAAESPTGRFSEPGEIAAAVVFLASDRAPTLTGTIVTMDGAASAAI